MARKALGKGFNALFPGDGISGDEKVGTQAFCNVPIVRISPNPLQPRRTFHDETLQGLAQSIREHGIVQPLVVTAVNGGYQLIVGERRLRAAEMAGLEEVPVIVKDVSPSDRLELALLENLQREDLNPLEEAQAYQVLLRDYGLTQDDLAGRLGKSRPAVSNTLRLLNLPPEIREDLVSGIITAGHARALLAIENGHLLRRAWLLLRSRSLSVRQTEELVRKILEEAGPRARPRRLPPDWVEMQEELQRIMGAAVKIRPRSKDKGRIEVHYTSREELDRLLGILFLQAEAGSDARSIGVSLL